MNVNTFYRMKRQEPSVMKLTLLMKKLELTKQLSDKGLPMEFVNSTATYFQDDGIGVYHSHELFYESKIVTSNMFVLSKSKFKAVYIINTCCKLLNKD